MQMLFIYSHVFFIEKKIQSCVASYPWFPNKIFVIAIPLIAPGCYRKENSVKKIFEKKILQ